MKLTKLSALALIIVSLAGCFKTPEEVKVAKDTVAAYNEQALKTPQTIGTLPDGRVINLVELAVFDSYYHHYVYFVGDSITVNRLVQAGKSQRLDVQALIAPNATADDIIAKAKELEAQQTLQDESEYQRLKNKLGK